MRRNMFVQVKRIIAAKKQPAIQTKTWFKKWLILSRINISAPDVLIVNPACTCYASNMEKWLQTVDLMKSLRSTIRNR